MAIPPCLIRAAVLPYAPPMSVMSQAPARLRIVTGKGGVGKTTAATALALALARQKKNVLLAEFGGGDSVASLLGARPVGPQMREVLEHLWVVDMTAESAMREYALMTLKFELLYKAVFDNALVRHFLRMIPSLAELVMLGKIWFHSQEEEDGQPRFHTIVLDAPATGHALAMLKAPSAVARAVPAGPLKTNAQLIADLLASPQQTRVHPVLLPQEMPVLEALDIHRKVVSEVGAQCGTFLVNQMPPEVPHGCETLPDNLPQPVAALLEDARTQRKTAEESLCLLEDERVGVLHHLPKVAPGEDISFGAQELERVVQSLSEMLVMERW